MDVIMIKHYMSELDDDYHDINIDKLWQLVEKMSAYAKENGRELIYTTMTNDCQRGLPVNTDVFAEISYTGELSETEKNSYVNFLKRLSYNETYSENRATKPRCMLKLVRFSKINDEILIIKNV